MKIFRLAAALAVALAAPSIAGATTYNAVTDFSLTTNTASNTWSYWYNTSTSVSTYQSGLALNPFLFDTTCGFGTSCWDQTTGSDNLILQNITGSDALFGGSTARNDQLTFYTRSGIELVRFTAPTAGLFSVSGFFEGSAASPEVSTQAIAVDGGLVSQSTATVPFGTVNPFNFSESLAAGGTIDFFIAGTSTTSNSLATGFDATISPGVTSVPEPATVMLLGGALWLWLGIVRARSAAGCATSAEVG
jgi:PEP-CTERM motif